MLPFIPGPLALEKLPPGRQTKHSFNDRNVLVEVERRRPPPYGRTRAFCFDVRYRPMDAFNPLLNNSHGGQCTTSIEESWMLVSMPPPQSIAQADERARCRAKRNERCTRTWQNIKKIIYREKRRWCKERRRGGGDVRRQVSAVEGNGLILHISQCTGDLTNRILFGCPSFGPTGGIQHIFCENVSLRSSGLAAQGCVQLNNKSKSPGALSNAASSTPTDSGTEHEDEMHHK